MCNYYIYLFINKLEFDPSKTYSSPSDSESVVKNIQAVSLSVGCPITEIFCSLPPTTTTTYTETSLSNSVMSHRTISKDAKVKFSMIDAPGQTIATNRKSTLTQIASRTRARTYRFSYLLAEYVFEIS